MTNDLPSVGTEDDYKAWYEEAMVASNEAGFAGASAAETIRALVSEHDELASRVRELEGDAKRLDWIEWAASKRKVEIARSILGTGYEIGEWPSMRVTVKSGTMREVIDAALASKEQP